MVAAALAAGLAAADGDLAKVDFAHPQGVVKPVNGAGPLPPGAMIAGDCLKFGKEVAGNWAIWFDGRRILLVESQPCVELQSGGSEK